MALAKANQCGEPLLSMDAEQTFSAATSTRITKPCRITWVQMMER